MRNSESWKCSRFLIDTSSSTRLIWPIISQVSQWSQPHHPPAFITFDAAELVINHFVAWSVWGARSIRIQVKITGPLGHGSLGQWKSIMFTGSKLILLNAGVGIKWSCNMPIGTRYLNKETAANFICNIYPTETCQKKGELKFLPIHRSSILQGGILQLWGTDQDKSQVRRIQNPCHICSEIHTPHRESRWWKTMSNGGQKTHPHSAAATSECEKFDEVRSVWNRNRQHATRQIGVCQ